jgi:YbbR domain-containing protein
MFRWLAINLRTFFLAFALALAVWVIAVTASNPDETQTFPTPIPLEFVGQDPGLILTGKDVPKQVNVTLRAPHSIWQSLLTGESSIHAIVDLTGLGSGTHKATVQLQIAARPVRILAVNPASFDVTLEAQVSRPMVINLILSGQPATGYQAGQPTLDPEGVTVSGAENVVSQIDHVQATLDVTSARQNISATIPLQAVDKDGKLVSGAAIIPDNVTVGLSVVQQGGYRDLAVKVMTVGNPASGYSLTSVSAFPPIVTVYSANSSTIDAMPGYVETSPLDLSGATQDIQKQLGMTLPAGVTLIGEQTVAVTVGIASIQSSRTISYSPVDMVGQANGLSAHLSTQTVDVIVSGPLPVLDSLLFSDVHVQVDLTGLLPGTYQLTPKVSIAKQNVIVESILPGTVEVVITGMGTPTP